MNSSVWCSDMQCLTGPAHLPHPAAAAPEPTAPLSAGLFGRATVPIPVTLILSHTQFWLPELHQLEFRSDIWVSQLQAAPDLFKFSLVLQWRSVRVHLRVGALPIVLNVCEWVTLYDFSSAFRASSCLDEWLWSIANLKSLMQWKWRLLQQSSSSN